MTTSLTVPMISISNLTKTYGTSLALKSLSFDVPKGQVVGFLGPNGAGKSTTMKILTGYLQATTGQALIAGIDVKENSIAAQRLIGYLPENNPLYEDMMVYEYLDFVSDVRQIDRTERKKKIASAIERCGLEKVIGKDIGTLSKGYRQRVGLAQAIVHDPELLILDEPTSGLDPNQIIEIRNLIKELGQEKTVLMSTHILGEVQSTCSRVLIINNGQLVADDAPDQLTMGDGGTIHVIVAPKNGTPVDHGKLMDRFSKISGVTKVDRAEHSKTSECELMVRYSAQDPRRALFESIVDANLIMLEMRKKEVSLEETFRKLTAS